MIKKSVFPTPNKGRSWSSCGADFLSSAMGIKGVEMGEVKDIFGELRRLKWASYIT